MSLNSLSTRVLRLIFFVIILMLNSELQARDYLELPEVMSYIVDPELKHFSYDDLKVICEVICLCTHTDFSKRPLMKEISLMLESKIDTSVAIELKSSSLAWAELALSS